ncbi:MAG: (Fe-S)-binding protein [Methanosarcinales archaeon]|nr:(Fe-S)-binding protein [Methanosarcinales archaeon]
MMQDIAGLLPGYNCGECGYPQCRDYGAALLGGGAKLAGCPHLGLEKFAANIPGIQQVLDASRTATVQSQVITGVIDGLRADFTIAPLPGEPSCREDLYPFDHGVRRRAGDHVRYRPLGCPVVHFARVLDMERGILTVHLIGPVHRFSRDDVVFEDIGTCMVAGFEGIVSKGRVPDVGQTVKFLPEHCMMQKVHSGVVVHSEGKRVRIEGIDLKVW